MSSDGDVAEILWRPSEERTATCRMTRFRHWAGEQLGCEFSDYAALHEWSIGESETFWRLFLEFSGIPYSGRPEPVLTGGSMAEARWFPNLELSYAECILRRGFEGPAVVSWTESNRQPATLTYEELAQEVRRCGAALTALGVVTGDRVAGYLSNVPEAVVCALACSDLGATWCSTSPDFGLAALTDRLIQVKPKVLFVTDSYSYGGRKYQTVNIIRHIRDQIPSIQALVSVPYPGSSPDGGADLSWESFLAGAARPGSLFERHPFNLPLFILFSSGTTGKPKCLVHGTGGTLIQHLKELQLHCDLGPGRRLLFFTTCGWMMWNWQLSALATGATIYLYDGSPAFPTVDAIWRDVDRLQLSHFGTSGRYLESCMKASPPVRFDAPSFQSLETVLYTGSPLSAEGYRWLYRTVKEDVHLAGISGGTDIISCFVLGNPSLPVRAGEIQCKGLGTDVAALDDEGQDLTDRPGELVCRRPLPSMPLGFLDDPEGSRYRETYFEHYPGLWRHGDWVEFRSSGGVVICGRSDATLNPGGVRIGSAELYAALDLLPWIKGAVVAGWRSPGEADERIVLAVVLQEEDQLNESLEDEIRRTLRESCSPRHVPAFIFQVSSIPVTRSGKPVEMAVKAMLAGDQIRNRDALANPEVLEEFGEIRKRLVKFSGRV